MGKQHIISILLFAFIVYFSHAQQSKIYTHDNVMYLKALSLYKSEQYVASQGLFQKIKNEVNNDQLKKGAGYDHNWIVNGKKGVLTLGATVYDPKSGRVMEVYSDKPGMQLYTGNFLEKDIGKDGKPYKRRYALCLEPQDFPDAPNKKNFPSTLLSPGETYSHTLIYKFSVR